MLIPIVIPQNSGSKTAEHAFEFQTPLGRVAQISVTTPVGISSQEVLVDLQKSTLDQVKVREDEAESPLGMAGISLLLWFVLALVGMLLFIVMDISDLIPTPLRVADEELLYWPWSLPFIGGTFFWTGMLRLWILGLPLVPLITYLVARKAR